MSSLLAPSDSLFLRATPSHSASVALLCQGDCGVAEVGGKTHSIKNIHWHTPSEHTIDGKRMAAELHVVSVAADGKIAVVSALFNPGKKNKLVDRALQAMAVMGDLSTTAAKVKKEFFSGADASCGVYKGSLTTPPCTQGVSWVVTTKVGSMSPLQLRRVRELNGGIANVRPLQNPNGRGVQWFEVAAAGPALAGCAMN